MRLGLQLPAALALGAALACSRGAPEPQTIDLAGAVGLHSFSREVLEGGTAELQTFVVKNSGPCPRALTAAAPPTSGGAWLAILMTTPEGVTGGAQITAVVPAD